MSELEKLRTRLRDKYIKELREELGWAGAQAWQTLTVPDTLTAEEIAEGNKLAAQWKLLQERGEEDGWLKWDGGYASGDWVVVNLSSSTKHPTRTIQRKETGREREARLAALSQEIKKRAEGHVERELSPPSREPLWRAW